MPGMGRGIRTRMYRQAAAPTYFASMKHRTMLSLLFACAVPGSALPLPQYACGFTASPVIIDGRADDHAWLEADTVTLCACGDGNAPALSTVARLAWDSTCLYVLVRTVDPDVWGTMNRRDQMLFEEEAVEFYIDPDGDGRDYFEFQFNSLGAIADICMRLPWDQAGGGGDLAWNASGVRVAVLVHGTNNNAASVDTGLTVEAAFAWSDFAPKSSLALPPSAGDTLRVNIYRVEGRNAPKEMTCWSPVETTTGAFFHTPAKFGLLLMHAGAPSSVRTPPTRRLIASLSPAAGARHTAFDCLGRVVRGDRPQTAAGRGVILLY